MRTWPASARQARQGIPLPAVPEIATVFEATGLAEANVLKGSDPTTEFTDAAAAVRERIGG